MAHSERFRSIVIQPGAIGMTIDWEYEEGAVIKITPGSQASQKGVKVGWLLHEIEGMPYSHERLQSFKAGRDSYTLVFLVDDPRARRLGPSRSERQPLGPRPATLQEAHARHQHLGKQGAASIHQQRDALVKKADKKLNWKEKIEEEFTGHKAQLRVLAVSTCLSWGAMVAYGIVQYSWFRVYHFSFSWTMFTQMLLIAIGISMIFVANRKVGGRDRMWLRFLGMLFILSTIVSMVVGGLLYFKSLAYYWRYQDLRPYTNVAGSQSAAAFPDANMFLWTEDTRLDAQRSVGYKSRFTGEVYCVAPIVDGTMADTNPVSYFAVGDNCCNARADFQCGDAMDPTVRSSLVLLEPEDVVRSFMTWAVKGAVYPRYERAINLQRATYGSTSSQTVKLVYWTKDPVGAMNAFYNDARTTAIWTGLLYFVSLEALACLITVLFIMTPKEKIGGAFRQDPHGELTVPVGKGKYANGVV
jgi:hypothetical protein